MDFNCPSRLNAKALRSLAIELVRIRKVKREIKLAVISFRVNYVVAFGSSVVTGLLLRTDGSTPNRDSVRRNRHRTTHQNHGMRGLSNDDPIDSLREDVGRRRLAGFKKENRQQQRHNWNAFQRTIL